jgi:vitamin B12 transporter
VPLPGAAPLALNKERSLKNTGFVAEYNLNLSEAFGLSAAYRRDWNSGFDDSNTYRLGASYLLDNGLKFHAAYGTGFKAPTNFELFGFDPGTFVGNPDLKPELSRGWEIGAQQEIGQTALIGAAYFNNTLENEIFTIFTPSFETTVVNLTMDSKQRGIEFFASADLDNGISLDASYTYLDAEESGAEEIRRAPHIASGTLSWHGMDERFGAFVSVRYNGEQKDSNFTLTGPPLVTLPGYALVSAGGDWRLNENVQFFGRVENLFDADYEDVYTFGTAGRAFYVGIRGSI